MYEAEQRQKQEERRQEELRQQYIKEQEIYKSKWGRIWGRGTVRYLIHGDVCFLLFRELIGKANPLNFMYEPPPGLEKGEINCSDLY